MALLPSENVRTVVIMVQEAAQSPLLAADGLAALLATAASCQTNLALCARYGAASATVAALQAHPEERGVQCAGWKLLSAFAGRGESVCLVEIRPVLLAACDAGFRSHSSDSELLPCILAALAGACTPPGGEESLLTREWQGKWQHRVGLRRRRLRRIAVRQLARGSGAACSAGEGDRRRCRRCRTLHLLAACHAADGLQTDAAAATSEGSAEEHLRLAQQVVAAVGSLESDAAAVRNGMSILTFLSASERSSQVALSCGAAELAMQYLSSTPKRATPLTAAAAATSAALLAAFSAHVQSRRYVRALGGAKTVFFALRRNLGNGPLQEAGLQILADLLEDDEPARDRYNPKPAIIGIGIGPGTGSVQATYEAAMGPESDAKAAREALDAIPGAWQWLCQGVPEANLLTALQRNGGRLAALDDEATPPAVAKAGEVPWNAKDLAHFIGRDKPSRLPANAARQAAFFEVARALKVLPAPSETPEDYLYRVSGLAQHNVEFNALVDAIALRAEHAALVK